MVRPGYVYLLRLEESDDLDRCSYKIGKSVNADIRQSQLGIVMPYELTLLVSVAVSDMDATEAYFHRFFASSQLRGEWFRFNDKDVRAFLGIAKRIAGAVCVCRNYTGPCPFLSECIPFD
jgi:hypothetical protein